MSSPNTYVYSTRFMEDGAAVVRARVSAQDGTGMATGVPGEGYLFRQSDLSSITCLVYDVTGGAVVATPSVSVSSAILDTPDATAAKWRRGGVGYNFTHTLSGTNFPTGGSTYRVEYKFTTTGGNVYWMKIEGVADACYTS